MSKITESDLILSLQFNLDTQNKINSEYLLLINEQQNEINNLKNKIKFLESEIKKQKIIKEEPIQQDITFTQKISKWFYLS